MSLAEPMGRKRKAENFGSDLAVEPIETEAAPEELRQAAGAPHKAAPGGKRRGRPSKAALKTPKSPGQCTPAMARQAVDDSAEQKLSGRRSGRRHTRRGADGKFYDQSSPAAQPMPCLPHLEEAIGDPPASQTCTEAVSSCYPEAEEPLGALHNLATEGGNSRLAANTKEAEGSSGNDLLSNEASISKPAVPASPMKPHTANTGKARPTGQGRKAKQKPSQENAQSQSRHHQSENQDPQGEKPKRISMQGPATLLRSPLSPRQPTAVPGRKADQVLRVPAACLAQTPVELQVEATDIQPISAPSPFVALPASPPKKEDPDWFDPADKAKVQAVEATLNVSSPSLEGATPLCRDSQGNEMLQVIQLHVNSKQGGSIYVSGVPGTGKSLTVHEVARQAWQAVKSQGGCPPQIVSINCMSLKQPGAVFMRALSGFQTSKSEQTNEPVTFAGTESNIRCPDPQEALKDYVQLPISNTPVKKGGLPHSMLILILDELDSLRSQDCSILYSLFGLPQLPGSRLILIGISNSIDIVERHLPRLKETGNHPHAVPFPSYSATQVGNIIRQRLVKLPGPVFQEAAIAFCARKIASSSGDMRRALEACSVALLNLTVESNSKAPEENADLEGDKPVTKIDAPAVKRRRQVGIGDMAKAISTLRGGSGEASALVQAMRALPQQQQLVLCAATKLLGQAEPAFTEPSKGPTTPQSISKGPRPRMASFMSPNFHQKVRTPTAKSVKPPTPKATPASCSRLALLGSAQECSLGVLHESYSQLCKQVSMKPLNSLEFAASCSNLADMGILAVGNAKEERLKKISLRAHKDDVALALQDVRLLRNLLSLL